MSKTWVFAYAKTSLNYWDNVQEVEVLQVSVVKRGLTVFAVSMMASLFITILDRLWSFLSLKAGSGILFSLPFGVLFRCDLLTIKFKHVKKESARNFNFN